MQICCLTYDVVSRGFFLALFFPLPREKYKGGRGADSNPGPLKSWTSALPLRHDDIPGQRHTTTWGNDTAIRLYNDAIATISFLAPSSKPIFIKYGYVIILSTHWEDAIASCLQAFKQNCSLKQALHKVYFCREFLFKMTFFLLLMNSAWLNKIGVQS